MDYLTNQRTVLGIVLLCLVPGMSAFNYLDYANLFDGIIHLNSVKLTGRESWCADDKSWRAWEFLGIRYATAERFQPPKFFDDYSTESRESFESSKAFSELGSACAQSSTAHVLPRVNLNKTSEDCLFLNIHLPPVNQEQTLLKANPWPVLIFIHGGEFQGGAGHYYDGNELARDIESVVITLNYRLGPFGFLSTEDFNAKGNWGLKDVIMAVRWVHQYIGRFGADASKIVLAGHGSGAALVSLALMDQDARDMLSGAIIMSGSSLHHSYITDSPRTAAMDLAKSAGCPIDNMQNLIGCLRNQSASHIQRADVAASRNKTSSTLWLPVVDGDLIPYDPQWVLRSSKWEFKGSILQGFSSHKKISVPPTLLGFLKGVNVTINGSMENQLTDRLRLVHAGAASYVTPSIGSILGCNVTQEVVEKILRHYSKDSLGRTDQPETVLQEALQTFLLDAKLRLAVYQEATEYGKNSALLREPGSYQLYRVDFEDGTSTAPSAGQSDLSEGPDLIELAYLFGGRLGEIVLGPDHSDYRITEQLRHLVGSFLKQGRSFGTAYDLKGNHLLYLGKSKRWEIIKDSSVADTVNFWQELRSAAC